MAVMEYQGYVFESFEPVMGKERWIGRSANGKGLSFLDLQGSPDLVSGQIVFPIVEDVDAMGKF
jgi:hypothetical protein